jgi:hypothetical protein
MENGNGITKADLTAALTVLKVELKKEIVDELTDATRQIETNLLTEFHRYGKGQQLRRLLHLESRRPPTV